VTVKFMALQEVAAELGVDVQTVRRWVHAGKLRAFKPGKEYRVREADLEEFLNAREVRPKAEAPPSQQLTLNGALEEERRAVYLRTPLEEVRGQTETARWALEDVPSFTEAPEGINPALMLDSWNHFISELRSDAHVKARRWGDALDRISGQEMPAWERNLLDEIRRELERYVDVVEKLSTRFNNEWASFQQRRADAELGPSVRKLWLDHAAPIGNEQSRDAV
jgi:excisionase family DNA binding protein